MRSSHFKALFIKESLQIIRDPSSILIAVVLPLILLFMMGYAISLDARKIPIGIVVETPSPQARTLVDAFEMSPSFTVSVGYHRGAFEKEIKEGRIRALFVIPESFSRDLARGKPTVQILADGTEPNIAGYVQKYGAGVWQSWLARQHLPVQRGGIEIETRYWFNAPLLSSYFLLPGSIAIILTLIGTMLTALVVAREWERGTMEAIMSTPISIIELLLGKLMPYFMLGMMSAAICVVIAIGWFEVPFRGSLWLLFLTCALYLFPALSLGLLISTLAKNQFVASQAALIIGFLPAMLLSGFIFQISSMPEVLQYFTLIIPARYLVAVLQTLFLSGDIYSVILPNLAAITAVGTVIFAVIYKITRKRLD